MIDNPSMEKVTPEMQGNGFATLPWVFEPCENEGPVCDTYGQPWAHAVRGQKPQRPAVIGYGHHPEDASFDARSKASQQDARDVLGERGEVVTQLRLETRWVDDHYMITVYDIETDTALAQGQLATADFYIFPPSPMSGLGSVWDISTPPWQAIGT